MKSLMVIAMAAVCASASTSAQAPQIADFNIAREARQLAFLNSTPGGDHVYSKGDLLLDVPLVWELAAKLIDPVTIKAGSDSVTLAPGTTLQAVVLSKAGLSAPIKAYCTPRVAGERKADKGVLGAVLGGGSLWRGILRGATDRQYCLLDADDDGIADQSALIHAGTPEMRTPVPIAPTRLDRQANVPISDQDRLQIRIVDIPQSGKSITLWLDVIQQGSSRRFTSFGTTNRLTSVSLKQPLPHMFEMLGARFEVLASGGPERKATIRQPDDADRNYFVAIPDALQIVMRFY